MLSRTFRGTDKHPLRPLIVAAAALAGVSGGGACAAAETSIALPGDRAFPESITSAHDGILYVGRLVQGGVVRIEPHDRQARVWIAPGASGSRSVFGVLADENSNTLWVCSNDLSAAGITVPGSDAGSTLKQFDLKTGEGKGSAALPGSHTLCNDIVIGADGSAYVTNSSSPEILRLPPKGKKLEVWLSDASLQPASGAGLDGIAFGSDGNLYVDTYTPGELYRIDLKQGKAGKITKLHVSRPLVLADAIRAFGKDSFLLVEGGGRLDKIVVKGDAVTVDILRDGLAVPTGVAIVGRTAWVSEGQLSYIFDPSKKGQSPSLPFHVYAVALPGS